MKRHDRLNNGIDEFVLYIRQSIWHRDGPFQVFWSIAVAAAVTLLLFSANRILFPFYRNWVAEDSTVQIIATGTRNPDALETNIRLSEIRVNGEELELDELTYQGNWQYSATDAFVYAYHSREPVELMVCFEELLDMELTFVSERGAGIVEILVNGKQAGTLDLYSDTDWSFVTWSYDANALVHPETHGWIWFLLFGFSCGLYWLIAGILSQRRMDMIRRGAVVLLKNAVLALIVTLAMWFIQYQDIHRLTEYLSGDYLVILKGYLLILLLMLFLYQICQSSWLSFTILSVVLECLLIVSHIKLNARGTPLLPWDFLFFDAALSVASNYDLFMSLVSTSVVAGNAIISYTLFWCRNRLGTYSLKKACAGGAAAALAFAVFLNTSIVYGVWTENTGSRVYQINDYYEKNGFLVSFAEYINYLLPVQAPDDYSEEVMDELVEEIMTSYAQTENISEKKPNIIAIMSESFWDITSLENVTFSYDPLPVLHSLQSTANSGELLSHVFGGNTVISEFEFLTGFHAAFFPTDYMVYGGSMDAGFCSAASLLSGQGYHAVAMHPYAATNYNRNTAYKMLGFSEMVFEDDFPEDAQRVRGYISDDAMYRQILDVHGQLREESDAPLFLFGITMQSHGGYWKINIHEQSRVPFQSEGYLDSTVVGMDDYFASLHSSDAALGNLISYFEQLEEDTIVIYFGDHMSNVGGKAQKMLECQSWYQSNTFAVDVKSHTVPYVVWSNCDLDLGQMPMMDIGQLLPMVLAEVGIEMPQFWNYLQQKQQLLPAFNHAIAVNADRSETELSDLTEEQKRLYRNFELLTYDYIWGEQYAASLWDVPGAE